MMKTHIAIENGLVEIVDLPINSMMMFQFANCGCLPEGNPGKLPMGYPMEIDNTNHLMEIYMIMYD